MAIYSDVSYSLDAQGQPISQDSKIRSQLSDLLDPAGFPESSQLSIGTHAFPEPTNSANRWYGAIDDVRIIHDALAPESIKAMYLEGSETYLVAKSGAGRPEGEGGSSL